jgi:hypothetical protein
MQRMQLMQLMQAGFDLSRIGSHGPRRDASLNAPSLHVLHALHGENS